MRILFVAIAESIHTARWLSQLSGENWDLHLFPSDIGIKPHQDYQNLTIYSFFRGRLLGESSGVRRTGLYWPFRRGKGRIKLISERLAPNTATESARLARTIRSLKPDIIHVLEMQSSGYLALEAKKRLPDYPFPPCIYSSWGSDLFLYGRQHEHEERIRAFLAHCDYYIADCERDLGLVREFGFKGQTLGVFVTAGGYDLNHLRQFRQGDRSSTRKVIALKGYQGIRGATSLVAIQGLRMVSDLLPGFELVVYLASDEVKAAMSDLSNINGLTVNALPESPHDEVIKLLGRSRVAIGVGHSDGTPNAMLEAMVMGAFPIQSDTLSTAEWIKNGENGLLVRADDPVSVADAIRRALIDDDLVDRAADLNTAVTQKIDRTVIKPKVVDLYRKVAARG